MWDNYYSIEVNDHILEFNGLSLIDAKFEPDHNCLIDVPFSENHYICGASGLRHNVTRNYRGLRGALNYQVDVLIDDTRIKTFMVQTTPMGDILSSKD
jgi:hypothetical protein